jgi:hypothetical protein
MALAGQLTHQMEEIASSQPVTQGMSAANCPICFLPPPTQGVNPEPSCTTFQGTGPTYLILVGDPGLEGHNVIQGFNLAAQTEANFWQSQGNNVVACRVSSVQNVVTALTTSGLIGGGVVYFGHSGPFGRTDPVTHQVTFQFSALGVGEQQGADTNVDFDNVSLLSAVLNS